MNVDTRKFLSIIFQSEYDATNKTSYFDTYLKIDVSALRNGLLQAVRGSDLTVLLAIASFMDKDGYCYPTQRQIAELCGLSLTTVNRSISNLLNIAVNNKPILERTFRGTGQKKNSIYTIFDIAPNEEDVADIDSIELDDLCIPQNRSELLDILKKTPLITVDVCGAREQITRGLKDVSECIDTAFSTPTEYEPSTDMVLHETNETPVKKKPMNSKDFAHYFADRFKETYGKSYVINYKRDLGLIKNKLVKHFEEDDILAIIDIAVGEYSQRWANPKFPSPTIGMLCSWLCNEVVKVLVKQEKKQEEIDELIKETSEFTQFDYSSFDNI